MVLSCCSTASLKNNSTCTGGWMSTALAAGLECNNKACASAGVTAQLLLYSRTIRISHRKRFLVFKRITNPLTHRGFAQGCYADPYPDQPDQHTQPDQPIGRHTAL